MSRRITAEVAGIDVTFWPTALGQMTRQGGVKIVGGSCVRNITAAEAREAAAALIEIADEIEADDA